MERSLRVNLGYAMAEEEIPKEREERTSTGREVPPDPEDARLAVFKP